MQAGKKLLIVGALLVLWPAIAAAADFDWTRGFNQRAEADPWEFRTKMSARFQVGDAQIDAVISNTKRPADAYITLRLAEISRQPADYALEKYRTTRGKGWGAVAKSLGIKPGSKEFHALKRGSDLYDDDYKGKGNKKGNKKGGRNSRSGSALGDTPLYVQATALKNV